MPCSNRTSSCDFPRRKNVESRKVIRIKVRFGENGWVTDFLKKRNVREELRAYLLGHRGKSETSERYCEATEIAAMYKLVRKMPVVTSHLIAYPVNLLPWVADKSKPPFSHPSRAKIKTQ